MMRRYEALILASPEITKDEATFIETEIGRLSQAAKGATISFERWGKFKLAYPINKNDYGVYFLARMEVPTGSSFVEDMKMFFRVKVHESVMRHVMCALDMKQPLTYQRPKSLEEVPASHDVGAFLKENKMEGLLPSFQKPRSRDGEGDQEFDYEKMVDSVE